MKYFTAETDMNANINSATKWTEIDADTLQAAKIIALNSQMFQLSRMWIGVEKDSKISPVALYETNPYTRESEWTDIQVYN